MDKMQVGQYIKDNDPRRPGRIFKVEAVDDIYAHIVDPVRKRLVSIKVDRIHLDGKARAKGYNRVPAPAHLAQPTGHHSAGIEKQESERRSAAGLGTWDGMKGF